MSRKKSVIISIVAIFLSAALSVTDWFFSFKPIAALIIIYIIAALSLYASAKIHSVKIGFFEYCALLILPIYCFMKIFRYDFFSPYLFGLISLAVAVVFTVFIFLGKKSERSAASIIICLVFSFTAVVGVLNTANIGLDYHKPEAVMATVQRKYCSTPSVKSFDYRFYTTVKSDEYGTFDVAVSYWQSKAMEQGDTITIQVASGLLGKKYYYFETNNDKAYYDFRFAVDDNDELLKYSDSLCD